MGNEFFMVFVSGPKHAVVPTHLEILAHLPILFQYCIVDISLEKNHVLTPVFSIWLIARRSRRFGGSSHAPSIIGGCVLLHRKHFTHALTLAGLPQDFGGASANNHLTILGIRIRLWLSACLTLCVKSLERTAVRNPPQSVPS